MSKKIEPAPYQPIPVEVAACVGEKFGKTIVIVCAWDPVYGVIHTTTWGKAPLEKHQAAAGGAIAARALGSDLSRMSSFEDFRDGPCAEARAIMDEARKLLKLMDDAGVDPDLGDESDRVFAWYEFEPLRQAFAEYDAKASKPKAESRKP